MLGFAAARKLVPFAWVAHELDAPPQSPQRGKELLRIADGRVLFAMKGHTQSSSESASGIAGVSSSPDGALLAPVGYDDKTVRLWNAANGQSVFTLQRNNAVEAVAFSPDGKILATLETAVDASGGSILSPEGGFRFWGVR
jgi:WD40 repeat protein